MSQILVSAPTTSIPLAAVDLAALELDEPLYLGDADVTSPPALPPLPAPPTLDEVARRAAQIVLEIQASVPKLAEDAPPPPRPRRIRKIVVRDPVTHRISEVLEEELP